MYEPDDNQEAMDRIPLKNLPSSGLTAYEFEDWDEQHTPPNNVLIAGLDQFSRVTVVGQKADDGELYFASSSSHLPSVIEDLKNFIHTLEQYMDN